MSDSHAVVKDEEQPDGSSSTLISPSNSTTTPAPIQDTTNKPDTADKTPPAKKTPLKSASTTKKPALKHKPPKIPTKSSSTPPTQQSIALIPNPLFGRAGSASIKEEDISDVQLLDTAPAKRPRGQKNTRPRRKGPASKVAELMKHLSRELEREEGVVVEARMMGGDGPAVNSLTPPSSTPPPSCKSSPSAPRSPLPFRLTKTTLFTTGPYANQVAILLRQETPFRLLALPLHIRTKIFSSLLQHHEPSIPIASKTAGSRLAFAPTYSAPYKLSILQCCKQLHAETAPIVYSHTFQFPNTGVASDFLLRIGVLHRSLLTALRSLTYTSQTARTMFHLLGDARHLRRLSFAHVSSSETPGTAVRTLWRDAGTWLLGLDPRDPMKGLGVLVFDESAFHVREKVRGVKGYAVVQWGAEEQLEYLRGLRGVMKEGVV